MREHTCYVATLDNTLVGSIGVQPTYPANEFEYFTRTGVAAVHQFAIDAGRQGLGIGRMLLAQAEFTRSGVCAANRWGQATGTDSDRSHQAF